jgi:hypothetical protein
LDTGQEVLVNYMDGCQPDIWTYLPKQPRDFHMYARWYFVCKCPRCEAEGGYLAKQIQEELVGLEIAMKAVYATYVYVTVLPSLSTSHSHSLCPFICVA